MSVTNKFVFMKVALRIQTYIQTPYLILLSLFLLSVVYVFCAGFTCRCETSKDHLVDDTVLFDFILSEKRTQ